MITVKFKKIGYRPRDKDLEAIASIFKACFPSQKKAKISYLKEMVKSEIKSGHRYILARKKNQTVGFVSWRVWGEPRHQLAELYHIAISPQFSGQGIGTILIDQVIKAANQYYRSYKLPGLRKLFVLTHASNHAAHRVYRKAGLKKVAVLPDFFHQGVDEFVFAIRGPTPTDSEQKGPILLAGSSQLSAGS